MEPSLIQRLLDLAVTVQQIPAPTFAEGQRAAFIREQFSNEGLCDVAIDEVNNVYGRLPGAGFAPPLVVSAHLDTVFPASTGLAVTRTPERIYGPGIGDNSLGVAGLLGLVWALRQASGDCQMLREIAPQLSFAYEGDCYRNSGNLHATSRISKSDGLPGDVWLVANTGEEGLGDLGGMRAVVERFGERVLAYIILEGMALGHIYHRALAVRRYRITLRTAGGHSWVDYGKPSAVHELAALITRLAALPIPTRPRASLNVGVIEGGTTVNTIAAEAHLELDLRSESAPTLNDLVSQVERLVQAVNYPGLQSTAEVIGLRPSGRIPASHPLVRLAERCLIEQGLRPNLTIGSTDANLPLSLGLPALCLGLSTGGGAHTVDEYVNISPLNQGMEQLLGVVEGAFLRVWSP
jgi:acetylornithine deacetylase/succinyl-diaminopimelate desuccinylase-like protein